jgi:DNA invertase Pin-like site-specific DNA recombinase
MKKNTTKTGDTKPALVKVRKRAALYLRVSTDDQTTMNQIAELEQVAKTRGWTIVGTFDETASGVARARPVLARLLELAHRGGVDVVAVWALDRIGRSMQDTIRIVLELERVGVELVSMREPWLDTGGPVRSLLVSIFAWVAEQERTRLGERVRAGQARARQAGVKIGRPSTRLSLAAVQKLRRQGMGLRKIARQLKVSYSTTQRLLSATTVRQLVSK